MKMKQLTIAKKKVNIIFIHLILIMFFSIYGFYFLSAIKSSFVNNQLFTLSWISNFILLWCIYSWKKITGSLFSPYILFLVSSFVFYLGQTFLLSLGIEYKKFNLFKMFVEYDLFSGIFYSCLIILFMHLGGLIAVKPNLKKESHFSLGEIKNEKLKDAVRLTSIILVSISAFPFLKHHYTIARLSIVGGYGALYEMDTSSIVQSLQLFFLPGLFLLVSVYKKKPLIRNVVTFVIAFTVLFGYIGGGRGFATGLIISYIWLWHVQIRPFNGMKSILLIFMGGLILILLNVVGTFRIVEGKSVDKFLQVFTNSFVDNNPIFNSIGEMGYSMFPLIHTMKIVPFLHPFKYGLTYLFSTLLLIPSFLRFGVTKIGIENNLMSLGSWLMTELKMTYGPGFSLPAEAYYNFGWLGVIPMFLFGYILVKFMRTNVGNEDQSIISNSLTGVLLTLTITMTRGSSQLLLKYISYYIIIPMFLISVIYSYNKRGRI